MADSKTGAENMSLKGTVVPEMKEVLTYVTGTQEPTERVPMAKAGSIRATK